MNTCPNCGKMAGLHSSVLQGCMCQYSMQAMKEGKDFTVSKPWVSLTDEEIDDIDFANWSEDYQRWNIRRFARSIEAKLNEKNA